MKNLSREDMAKSYTEMMTKNCALTTDQVDKIKQINLDYVSRMKEDVKENSEKYEKEYDDSVKNIFNEDQYKKWETNKKSWVDTLKETWNNVKEDVKDGMDEMKKK